MIAKPDPESASLEGKRCGVEEWLRHAENRVRRGNASRYASRTSQAMLLFCSQVSQYSCLNTVAPSTCTNLTIRRALRNRVGGTSSFRLGVSTGGKVVEHKHFHITESL
jgi:hypothetical protein